MTPVQFLYVLLAPVIALGAWLVFRITRKWVALLSMLIVVRRMKRRIIKAKRVGDLDDMISGLDTDLDSLDRQMRDLIDG